jgi:hypothetical protein
VITRTGAETEQKQSATPESHIAGWQGRHIEYKENSGFVNLNGLC